ncbi:hypothetical protein CPB85DRAFT_884170 [Mucidula mucida]|nr:hypothetical protein CPB85DRAFT_884170 [Mucidula mucida]
MSDRVAGQPNPSTKYAQLQNTLNSFPLSTPSIYWCVADQCYPNLLPPPCINLPWYLRSAVPDLEEKRPLATPFSLVRVHRKRYILLPVLTIHIGVSRRSYKINSIIAQRFFRYCKYGQLRDIDWLGRKPELEVGLRRSKWCPPTRLADL